MSKKKNKRRPFQTPANEISQPPKRAGQQLYAENTGGVFGFFRDYGVRETIESIIVAIVLALMFRAYEAEAFIIPTGSMAPSLQGQHMDVVCEKCFHQYRAGASKEGSSTAPQNRDVVEYTYCPICQFKMYMNRRNNPDHASNNGDRILVNKSIYDFSEPKRFDVIVFKNPNNGKQNYIKRLIGLPGEKLLIENGDIFTMTQLSDGTYARQIVRKPSNKMKSLLQLVDDTGHRSKEMEDLGWPARWQQWNGENKAWSVQGQEKNRKFYLSSTDDDSNWLRYRHLIPKDTEWVTIEEGKQLPKRIEDFKGKLINDVYAYNDFLYKKLLSQVGGNESLLRSMGAHWVGDLGVECDVQIKSDTGTLALDLVEGGEHFVLSINVASGDAVVQNGAQSKVKFFQDPSCAKDGAATSSAKTNIQGAGNYTIEYVNADDRLYLWINNRLIEFDSPYYTRPYPFKPHYSANDPGDAEPIGVGGRNVELVVNRLKVLRDVYYTSVVNNYRGDEIKNESGLSRERILSIHEDPESWGTKRSDELFNAKKQQRVPMFEIQADQFLPMGDNSPESFDGRVWSGAGSRFVEREMMIGRAMFIYWPHSLNRPIKFFPNFRRMGFIR